ncbi:MAG: GNAT family N-acetyltransferase [Bdellovibrionota bacterium]
MNAPNFSVRLATIDDAIAIGTVQTLTWKTTYKAIVHQSFLDNLEAAPRITSAEKRVQNPALTDFVLVENETQKVVGFVCVGPNREKNVDADGEMYAIYILDEYHGRGGGKLLYQAAVNEILKMNFKKMMVSVFEDNISSRKFYEALGGQYIGSDHVDIEGHRYKTSTYLWSL